jgi:hypothetical protein
MSVRDRIRAWFDYDDMEARRMAARSVRADRDIHLACADEEAAIRAAVVRATYHPGSNASLVVPHVIDRITSEVRAAIHVNARAYPGDEDTLAEFHTGPDITVVPAWDNVDHVLGEIGDVTELRRGQGGNR